MVMTKSVGKDQYQLTILFNDLSHTHRAGAQEAEDCHDHLNTNFPPLSNITVQEFTVPMIKTRECRY